MIEMEHLSLFLIRIVNDDTCPKISSRILELNLVEHVDNIMLSLARIIRSSGTDLEINVLCGPIKCGEWHRLERGTGIKGALG